jgi:hypothetical protein
MRGAWGGFISILYILDKEIDIITWQKPTDVFHPLKGVE